jgi:hypothetical protein
VVSGRRDARLDSSNSLWEISVEDRAQDLLDGFFVKAAVQDPFVMVFLRGVDERSLQEISK